jgi:5'-nucleotidase / UDP-sugar diphosphatase
MGGRATPAGVLRLQRGAANPRGAAETELFLLAGDATAGLLREVIPAAGVIPPLPPSGLAERPFHLSILHLNDLHGRLADITPEGHQPVFSRMASHVRQLRRAGQHDPRRAVLFVAAGDDRVGTPFDELLVPTFAGSPGGEPVGGGLRTGGLRAGGRHAGYWLYSAAGLDAAVLGNHEFDCGARLLARAIARDARFPLLSANLQAGPPLAGCVYPAALLVVRGLRVGLAGLTTAAEIRQRRGSRFRLSHPLEAMHNLLPALQPLCDVLIVLSHLGHCLQAATAPTCDAGDRELAESLPQGSVHLIVGGHTHQALNEEGLEPANIVRGIPIVQAGAMGRFLGQVELQVGAEVAVTAACLLPVADLPVDEALEREEVRPLMTQVRPLLARRLGAVANHSDLTAEAVRGCFAAGESALANLITDALAAACRAAGQAVDLVAIDASAACDGLPGTGELAFGDWFQVMPHADTVRIYRLTGAQLAALLDDNARRADRPDEDHVERGFLHFSREMRYTLALGAARGEARAVQAAVDGLPLEAQHDRTFRLACTSFVRQQAAPWEREMAGSLGLARLQDLATVEAETDLWVRPLLVAHLSRHGGATEEAGARRDGRLRVVPPDVTPLPGEV